MARIVVVDPILLASQYGLSPGWAGDEHEVVFPAGFELEEVAPLLGEAEAILTAHYPVAASMMDLAPRLKLIAKPGAGVDNIDLEAAAARDVVVTNVSGTRSRAVAEHALFMITYLARRAWLLGDPDWKTTSATQLGNKTLGIIGLGAIGSLLARFAHGIGMEIMVHTRTPDPSRVRDVPIRFAALDDLLAQSDFVVVAVPLTDQTRGLIDAAAMRKMKPTAYIVNVSRGPNVVTDDLVAAVAAGEIAGAGLDVTDPEPLPEGHPLLAHPGVLVTPHNAGRTVESQRTTMARMHANVRAVLSGGDPLDPVLPATS